MEQWGLGLFGCGIGLAVLFLHCAAPRKLKKLESFRQIYGPTAGTLLHLFFYSLIPLAVGAYFLWLALGAR